MCPAESASAARTDLFGLLACARLTAFERRAADAGRVVSYEDKVVLGGLAVGAFAQFEHVRDRLIELGADPPEAMRPFEEAITEFNDRTRPADVLEALTKVYVGDAILADFYVAVAGGAEPGTQAVVAESLADAGHTELLAERLRAAADTDSRLASRLGLWARRLVGEALSQANAIVRDRATLAALVGEEGVEAMFGHVLDKHTARMRTINLRD
jgi:hypothetical protein